MNSAVIFSGPSTHGIDAGAWPALTFAPPAEAGDVVRAVRQGARVIGIVDGYFETTRSVWHKEILWALDRGVAVLGASSMGALRAAELAGFGMQGVGWVFEQYHSGILEDDDEVTLLHGPPETGYMPLTEALVNIRYGLSRAVADGAIGQAAGDAVLRAAKSLNYKERTFENILENISKDSGDVLDYETFLDYKNKNDLDRKRDDASDMFALMSEIVKRRGSVSVSFNLNMTEQLSGLLAEVGKG